MKSWNQFIIQNQGSFLQSSEWGKFNQALGRKVWRLETNGLKGLLIKHNLPFNQSYLYCPRGPVGEPAQFKSFLEKVKQIAQSEKAIFFKIEPDLDLPFKEFGLIQSRRTLQPHQTLILEILKPEEDLLKAMHHKTRYNLRLAQKKGIQIQSAGPKSLGIFLDLLEETAQRDKFHLHPRKYYQKMFEVLGKNRMLELFLVKRQNQIIAGNLVCFFGQIAYYLHGASNYNFRSLMAPYLLQWQAILEAKSMGLKYYDFWGIDKEKWPGVTRFKKGFGGKEREYPGTFDLIFKPAWYKFYNLARKII